MDGLRSCYISNRRLYPDRPDVLVRGRYYFAEPGTPFLPIAHCFGSMNDWRGQIEEDPPIGEAMEPREWCDGSPPQVLPMLRVAGDVDFLESGSPFGIPKQLSPVWAIPAACYPGALLALARFLTDLSLTDRRTLCWLASVCVESYAADGSQAEDLIKAVMGPAARFDFVPNDDIALTPGTVLAENDGFALCCVSGTTNQQQWQAHVINAIAGPTLGVNGWQTTGNTFNASTVVRDRLNTFLSGRTPPTIIMGHSWGGAIAQVLAARLRGGAPARPLKVLTFGAPKPGDALLAAVLDGLDSMRVSHELDVVPIMPPSFRTDEGFGLFGLVLDEVLAAWNSFTHSRRQLILDDAGNLTLDSEESIFPNGVTGIAVSLALGLPVGPVDRHVMIGYATRICDHEDMDAGEYPISESAEEEIGEALSTGPCEFLGEGLRLLGEDNAPFQGFFPLPRLLARSWETTVVGLDSNHYRVVFAVPAGASDPSEYTLSVTLVETGETVVGVFEEPPICEPIEFEYAFPGFVTLPLSLPFNLDVLGP